MVKIILETGVLDVSEKTNFPITFNIGDIRDLTSRKGTFSKTIVLEGTKNNHELLGNYYDVNIQAGTFNINTLTRCQVPRLMIGVSLVSPTFAFKAYAKITIDSCHLDSTTHWLRFLMY